MRIVIDTSTVSAEDADNLTSLEVALRGITPAQAGEALQGIGHLAGEHVWLRVEALRAMAPEPEPRSANWNERFEDMLAYAQGKGWTNETRDLVRAHLA